MVAAASNVTVAKTRNDVVARMPTGRCISICFPGSWTADRVRMTLPGVGLLRQGQSTRVVEPFFFFVKK